MRSIRLRGRALAAVALLALVPCASAQLDTLGWTFQGCASVAGDVLSLDVCTPSCTSTLATAEAQLVQTGAYTLDLSWFAQNTCCVELRVTKVSGATLSTIHAFGGASGGSWCGSSPPPCIGGDALAFSALAGDRLLVELRGLVLGCGVRGSQETQVQLSSLGITAVEPPVVTSLDATPAFAASAVTIAGTGLGAPGTTVTIDGAAEPIVSQSPTQIVIEPGTREPGFGALVVTNAFGSTSAELAFLPTFSASGGGLGQTVEATLASVGPGAFLWALAPLAQAPPIPFGPTIWHGLELAPLGALVLPEGTGTLPASGAQSFSIPVANNPSWQGIELFFQGLVATGTTPPFSFTNRASVVLATPPLAPPSNLSYATNPAVYPAGQPIAPNVPTVTGAALSFVAFPTLPAGLFLDPGTGVISGTPSAPAPQAIYTIVAQNAAGGTATSLDLTVSASFAVTSVSVTPGSIWQINRPIDVTFDQPVDFASVNLSTFRITDVSNGQSALGSYFLLDPQSVRFQPACPLEADFSDAGLELGTFYQLSLPAAPGPALQSLAGVPLQAPVNVPFMTPPPGAPNTIFFDAVAGPPAPVVRPFGSSELDATHLEIGGDAGSRVYFELDSVSGTFTQPLDIPLDLYSDVDTRVAVVLVLDQPIDASPANLTRLSLEEESGPGVWQPLPSSATLEANCTETGARVRLEPESILPQLRRIRVVIDVLFADIAGQPTLLAQDGFGVFRTLAFFDANLVPPDDLADEVLEPFDGDALFDASSDFPEPVADWGSGVLRATFEFEGDGGPNGDFDVLVPSGTTLVFDTTSTLVQGGPLALQSVNTTQQLCVAGVLDVRNLRIESGATLRAQGPNPLQIRATGDVEVLGVLDADGVGSPGVATLNTGNIPELGASGGPAGGRGGTGSFVTNSSTPRGGSGFGAFAFVDAGGSGGESGFAPGPQQNRRPGGGGGGVLGPNAPGGGVGLVAERGEDGAPTSTSAITFTSPARGGPAGVGPFVDGDPGNDFFGWRYDALAGTRIEGELPSLWAGTGGGAGGDAIPGSTFPSAPWTPASDEKGAGGGGGGGGVSILALGVVRVGAAGRIRADGGAGGGGENVIFVDRVGGGSGGGSGGHIVLAADTVDVSAAALAAITALGGAGGPGANGLPDVTNAGGDGGPGIVQVHAPNLVLQPGQTLADVTSPDALLLEPFYGPRSRARSTWIPLGGAEVGVGGTIDQVSFFFGGTDTASGLVLDLDQNGGVDPLPPLLAQVLVPAPGVPSIGPSGFAVTLDATPIATGPNDVYLRNPQLLRWFAVELVDPAAPATSARFDVVDASADTAAATVTLVVDGGGPPLTSFVAPAVEARLVPRFFQVETLGGADVLPQSASVRVLFEGTGSTPSGAPDEASILVPANANAAALDVPGVDFFRFDVLFDVGTAGPTTPLPALRFLRVPFRF